MKRGNRPIHTAMHETESQLQTPVQALLLTGLVLLFACSPTASDPTISRSRFLMGTPLTVTVPNVESNLAVVETAFEEVARVESLISTWREDSALAELNQHPVGATAKLDAELFELLELVADWSDRTGGAFDPAIGRILFAWDLRGEGVVPSPEMLRLAIEKSGARYLELDRENLTATRTADLLIEEGGFGKGYALDRAASVLRESEVDDAMVDFGGQITLIGSNPVSVGIANPENRLQPALEVELSSASVATSSGSERFFESGGERYSHILDPRTGRALPPRGSVTVIHDSGLVADIAATALYVMGVEEGLEWSDRHGIAAIFIVPDSGGSWRVLTSTEASRSISIRAIDDNFSIERNHDS